MVAVASQDVTGRRTHDFIGKIQGGIMGLLRTIKMRRL